MKQEQRTYIVIDLKSFYASVECVERGLDPLRTNLVVADESRTEKTICLSVSPSLKAYGIPGRARLFQVIQKVREANGKRRLNAPGLCFTGESYDAAVLKASACDAISYITAPPRMALYMEYSARIYGIYMKYIAPQDIHVYSIDEVFMDITDYLNTYRLSPRELTAKLIGEVLENTGITATAGIGTNLYLCKVAMDIVAKHIQPDRDGVRIAELDEMSYRRLLWTHRPLTDFWRVGRGYAKKLEANGMFTMGDVARCSVGKKNELYNEELLYRLFGINAELLIDHAWGWEPCTMADIKGYKPETSSLGSGQVLHCPYDYKKARIVVREMTELLVLDLVDKGLVTDQIVLTVGYDTENIKNPEIRKDYKGEVIKDRYRREIPKHSHATANIGRHSSSARLIVQAAVELYDRIVNEKLLIRRINVTANHIIDEKTAAEKGGFEQLNLFKAYDRLKEEQEAEEKALEKEKRVQKAMIDIKKKFGKNAVIKGLNLQEGATAMERNRQIGGHKA